MQKCVLRSRIQSPETAQHQPNLHTRCIDQLTTSYRHHSHPKSSHHYMSDELNVFILTIFTAWTPSDVINFHKANKYDLHDKLLCPFLLHIQQISLSKISGGRTTFYQACLPIFNKCISIYRRLCFRHAT